MHIVKDHPTLPHDAEIHPLGWPLIDTDSKVTPPPPPSDVRPPIDDIHPRALRVAPGGNEHRNRTGLLDVQERE